MTTVQPLGVLHARRIGLLGTYPPRRCGLATFAAALAGELRAEGEELCVVAVDDGHPGATDDRADHVLVNGVAGSVRDTARVLSQCDVVVVQHEYGIYGGVDGDEIIDVLRLTQTPAIVVVHTVPTAPTAHQRVVLELVCDLGARVVVMTAMARDRLVGSYRVDAGKVGVIPHGAWSPPVTSGMADPTRLHLVTWGLLGPGKGIEHMIDAMALLRDLPAQYTIAGPTHPNVLARQGDDYRRGLIRQVWAAGVAPAVRFDDVYRDIAGLLRFVASASMVVLPYDSPDQVTSGVLVDAIAAGVPVIATAFPHAVELLADGAGIIVPRKDPAALASAVRAVADDPTLLAAMTARARAIAPSLSWHTVAGQYLAQCDELAPATLAPEARR